MDEVKKALSRIKVVGVYVPQLRMVPGFHAAVNDAGGKSIVVEFINGETKSLRQSDQPLQALAFVAHADNTRAEPEMRGATRKPLC